MAANVKEIDNTIAEGTKLCNGERSADVGAAYLTVNFVGGAEDCIG